MNTPLRPFELDAVRADFPILHHPLPSGQRLVYLDNGATTQKPQVVIDALVHYYSHLNSNVHRGAHVLADQATQAFEAARTTVQGFINAQRREEIIWTKGTTEATNLVASSFGPTVLKAGDRVIVSTLEHHANIVPWQLLCERVGAELCALPLSPEGDIDLAAYDALLDERTKIVAVSHVSNALGTVNPVAEIIQKAKAVGAYTLIDGAQALGHLVLDMQALGCDFYAMSAHKAYGPTGFGMLYGRYDLLALMPPYQAGGEMIEQVSFEKTTYQAPPFRFEAGTPDIAGAIATKAALDYLASFDRAELEAHENDVLAYAHERARAFAGFRLIGQAKHKIAILSFMLDGAHPQDVGMLLDQQGIAVRTGSHCTQPLMHSLGLSGTARASFALYNGRDDVDALFDGLEKVKAFL